MINYTVTKPFVKQPENISLAVSDSVSKYSDSQKVLIGTTVITEKTFYSWVGSPESFDYLEYSSTEADPSGSGISPIDPDSEYHTYDLVAKINEIISEITT